MSTEQTAADVQAAMARLRKREDLLRDGATLAVIGETRCRERIVEADAIRVLCNAHEVQAQELRLLRAWQDAHRSDMEQADDLHAKLEAQEQEIARLEHAALYTAHYKADYNEQVEKASIAEAQAGRYKAALGQQQPFLAFWRKVRESVFDDISDADCQDWAVEAGLLVEVPYDPAVHGDVEADPGDTIYVDAPWLAAALGDQQEST
jgi:hypothetical protein